MKKYYKTIQSIFLSGLFILGINIIVNAQPANDDCSNAILLTVGTTCNSISGTINSATESISPDNCGGIINTSASANDVWYKFIATTSTAKIYVVPSGSTPDSLLAIVQFYNSCGGASVGCAYPPDFGDTVKMIIGSLNPGDTYFFRVYGWESALVPNPQLYPDFDVCVVEAPAGPANDDCTNAISVTIANNEASCSSFTVNTTNATQSFQSISCAQISHDDDVWYSFVPTSSALIVKATNKSITGGIGFTLYEGSCSGTQSTGCTFNAPGDSFAFNNLTPSTTYYLRTFTQGNTEQGTYDLCLYYFNPLSNDDCSNAISINAANDKSSCTYTTVNTVGASQGTPPSCAPTSSDDDVWYSFVAVDTGMSIYADPSSFTGGITSVGMAVFDGVCGGIELGCDFQTNINGDSLRVSNLVIGNSYLLDVFSTSNTNQGTFQICVYGYLGTIGINERSLSSSISIYPNPSTGKYLVSNMWNKNSLYIEITNILGQTIDTYHIGNSNTVTLDLSGQPDGIYFVKIKTSGEIITKKIVLSR